MEGIAVEGQIERDKNSASISQSTRAANPVKRETTPQKQSIDQPGRGRNLSLPLSVGLSTPRREGAHAGRCTVSGPARASVENQAVEPE
mmetsp:Transcript_31654/g.62633  ORF Transcript_31654/g.62633 Transcript_31654/m.62633 type:complete len:89 (-) Transcript_31654:293-559(-)